MQGTAKVLVVVEDEADMRLLIRTVLAEDPRIQMCGQADTAESAIEVALSTEPGLVILDHALAGKLTGLAAAPLIKEVAPAAKILLFTAFDIEQEALAEPAIDAFLRKDRLEELLPVSRQLLDLDDHHPRS